MTVPVEVMLAACRGGLALSRAGLTGVGAAQAAELSECVCNRSGLDAQTVTRLRGLLALPAGGDAALLVAQEAVGGAVARDWLFAAARTKEDRLSARLEAIEERAAARILGHCEAVFVAAVARVGRKAADRVKRGGARGHDPVVWLDAQPSPVVRAALLELDEAQTTDAVSDLGGLVGPVLDGAAAAVSALLTKELGRDVPSYRLLPDVTRDEAVRVASVSVLSLTLGRLARSGDKVDVAVPPNIARDVLHVAGGADSTAAGGVPKSETGRVLVGGVESVGDGFVASQTVLEQVDPGATTELVWAHSASSKPNGIHEANDGRSLSDCDFRAGPPGGLAGCGCSWRKVVVIP